MEIRDCSRVDETDRLGYRLEKRGKESSHFESKQDLFLGAWNNCRGCQKGLLSTF